LDLKLIILWQLRPAVKTTSFFSVLFAEQSVPWGELYEAYAICPE
jgi:hypothetical protein